jgi:hypothetical protein
LTGPFQRLRPVHAPEANLAAIFNLRALPSPRIYRPLTEGQTAGLRPMRRPTFVPRLAGAR